MHPENPADALEPKEALKHFPGNRSLQSLNRWTLSGVAGPDGQRIRLKSIKVAGRRYITRQAIEEFIEACNAEPSGRPQHDAASGAQDADAARRAKAADAALEALGF